MTGPVLDFDTLGSKRRDTEAGDTREAPGILETIGAGGRVANDEVMIGQQIRLNEAYDPIVAALRERRKDNARAYQPDRSWRFDIGNPLSSEGRFDGDKVWRAIQQERAKDKAAFADLPQTRAEFEKSVLRRQGERSRDQDTLERGNGVAGFVGAIGGTMTDPVNLMTLPIGGFGKTLATKILTEGAVGAAVETAQLPQRAIARQALGEDLTAEEAVLGVLAAGGGAAALRGGFELAPGAVQSAVRKIDPDWDDKKIAQAFAKAVPQELRTPEQEAALYIINRSNQVEQASPFVPTHEAIDAHVGKMQEALDALEDGRIASEGDIESTVSAPADPPAPRAVASAASRDFARTKAAIRGPESNGDDSVDNLMGSSAAGRYQFISSTFRSLYQKEYGASEAEARRAWAKNRYDVDIQERLMDRLLSDNAAALERAGLPSDDGNLYLAHFAGSGKAVQLLQAPPDTPVAQFFGATAIKQNPTYLGGGKTVGEAIDIIRGKVGDPAAVSPVALAPETPRLRDPRLDADSASATIGGELVAIKSFRASEIDVDAELMQFKSGGDEFGVTDRLRGVEQWDGYQAGVVTVWEGADGRRLIADGHQRHGLARRVGAQNGEDIRLNAFVLRESDGFTAADARLITAIKNVGEGSGTKVDAAKIFRELPEELEGEILARLSKSQEFIKDARGISRLDDEAFGALVNEIIPESYGASIGRLVEDRSTHSAMVKILAETDPPNRLQAEAIIRQAQDAGFVKETQDSLFGTEELTTGLFAQRAKLLDKALRELKQVKGAFGVAVRNSETLEAGGNTIDVNASAAAIDANALALALVDRLALRKGNAVNDLLDQAAKRIASGEAFAPVLRDFVAAIRKLDLDDIARESSKAGGDGAGSGGSGRAGQPDSESAGLFGRELTPADADEIAAAKPRSDHTETLTDPDPRFAEPDGVGIRASSESAWHDIDAAKPEQQFDLGDGLGERSAADIRAELDADRAAIDEIRNCMK